MRARQQCCLIAAERHRGVSPRDLAPRGFNVNRFIARSMVSGAFAVGGLLVSTATASATTVCDLTTVGSSCSFGGAIFGQISPQPTGTGVIDPFETVQA